MAESAGTAWACWDQRTEVASAQRPLLRGDTFLPRGLTFLREPGLGPPLRLAVAKIGSGGL